MLYVYLLANIFFCYLGIILFKSKINPITIYSIIWMILLVLYELKLVYYHELTYYTWAIICTFQLLYIIGCVVGNKIAFKRTYFDNKNIDIRFELKKVILMLTGIASVGILSNVILAVRKYGFNLVQYIVNLYSDRLAGNIDSGIPYLGTFIYIALIFSGYYCAHYKFDKFLLFPIVLVSLSSLVSAGRLGLLQGGIYVSIPIFLNINFKKVDLKGKWGKIIGSIIIITLLCYVFIMITASKSSYYSVNSYMSPWMKNIVQTFPSVYKNYFYITAPLGVLNEFLKNPTFNFGGHTFLPLYSILEKLGFDVYVGTYQTFYYVPISCNVGTYIRELIEDFDVIFAMIVTLITGVIYGYNWKMYKRYHSFISLVWMEMFTFIIGFSFFMWQIRSSSSWIILVVGSIVGLYLDKISKKRR